MKKIFLIGLVVFVTGLGMFAVYALSIDHSLAASGGKKPLVPALPLLGPCAMGLVMMGLGLAGMRRRRP